MVLESVPKKPKRSPKGLDIDKRNISNKRARDKRHAHGLHAAYMRERRSKDPMFRFKELTRNAIYNSFRKNGYKKSAQTEQILGCTLLFFKGYIEDQFLPGMAFDNYGDWHIDHRLPLASANSVSDIEKLNHYTNLQPMWAIDNLKKGKK